MDSLRLKNIALHAHHGVSDEEIKIGQRYEVDVVLFFSMAPVAECDDLSKTVDYRKLLELVYEVVGTRSYRLLETLTVKLCEEILVKFQAKKVITVIRKINPPLKGILDYSEAVVTREKE